MQPSHKAFFDRPCLCIFSLFPPRFEKKNKGKPYKENKNTNSLLTTPRIYDIISIDGALAQLGARNTGSVEVRGSNPLCSTINNQNRTLFGFGCFSFSLPLLQCGMRGMEMPPCFVWEHRSIPILFIFIEP